MRGVVALVLVLPLAAGLAISLQAGGAMGLVWDWQGAAWVALAREAGLVDAGVLALGATLACLALAVPVAALAMVLPRGLRWLLAGAMAGALLLPGAGAITLTGLVGDLLPVMILVLLAALAAVDPALARAARDAGAGPLRVFWAVTWPLIRPGLAAGAVAVFALALGSAPGAVDLVAAARAADDLPRLAALGLSLCLGAGAVALVGLAWAGRGGGPR